MKARTVALLLATTMVLVPLIDTVLFYLQNTSLVRDGASSAAAAKTAATTTGRAAHDDRSTPARRDSAALSREKQEAAARLASHIIDYVRSIDITQNVTIDPPQEVMQALARLDANQHRLVMTTLCQDPSLDPYLRAVIGADISSGWLRAQGEKPDRAALTSALATLDLQLPAKDAVTHNSLGLVSSSLYYIANYEPDLAAQWFASHTSIFDQPGQYPDLEGTRAQLLKRMAGQPAAAIAQVEVLAPQDPAAMYAAIAAGGSHPDNLTETVDAFHDAARTAADPATADLIQQSLLTGLAERFRALPPAQAIAWMDEGHLSAEDQRTLFDRLLLFRSTIRADAWLAWAENNMPAEAVAAKVASLPEARPRPAPAPASPVDGK